MAQHAAATGNNPAPNSESIIPTARAAYPAQLHWVASVIAGNVITASVT